MATKTLGEAMKEVQELEQRAAIMDAVVNFLRTGYVSRDSLPAQKALACNGAPIPEKLVDEVAAEFSEASTEMRKAAKAVLGGAHVGG